MSVFYECRNTFWVTSRGILGLSNLATDWNHIFLVWTVFPLISFSSLPSNISLNSFFWPSLWSSSSLLIPVLSYSCFPFFLPVFVFNCSWLHPLSFLYFRKAGAAAEATQKGTNPLISIFNGFSSENVYSARLCLESNQRLTFIMLMPFSRPSLANPANQVNKHTR